MRGQVSLGKLAKGLARGNLELRACALFQAQQALFDRGVVVVATTS